MISLTEKQVNKINSLINAEVAAWAKDSTTAQRKRISMSSIEGVPGVTGFYVLLVKGAKPAWRLDYTFTSGKGESKTLSLGTTEKVGIVPAFTKAREYADMVAMGVNPSEKIQQVKAATKKLEIVCVENAKRAADDLPPVDSFGDIALQHKAHKIASGKWGKSAIDNFDLACKHHLFPTLRNLPIAQFDAHDHLLPIIHKLEKEGKLETSNSTREYAGQVCIWARALRKLKYNPVEDIRELCLPRNPTHMKAIDDPKLLGSLMRALYAYSDAPISHAALGMQLLLWQRPGNITAMEWTEINLDHPDGARWTIPAAKMKIKLRRVKNTMKAVDHVVPLPWQAVAIINAMRPLTGNRKYVFQTSGKPVPMCAKTLNEAIERLGFKGELTGHGMRSTAQTMLVDHFEKEDAMWAIEANLAHVYSGPMGEVYNRAKYVKQRTVILQFWADKLDELRESNVTEVSFTTPARAAISTWRRNNEVPLLAA